MAKEKINPMLKMALEMGPIVLFFIGYMKLKDSTFNFAGTDYQGFIVVTAAFIPLMILSSAILWKLTGHLSKMQIMTLVLVIVMGGLSVWLNDPQFIKMKPTMLYLLFGGVLGFGLLRGKSYLKVVMEEVLPMREEGWMILTKRLCGFFLALAVLNEVIWRTQDESTWAYFKTFGLTAAVFVFFISQSGLFQKYGEESKESEDTPDAAE